MQEKVLKQQGQGRAPCMHLAGEQDVCHQVINTINKYYCDYALECYAFTKRSVALWGRYPNIK